MATVLAAVTAAGALGPFSTNKELAWEMLHPEADDLVTGLKACCDECGFVQPGSSEDSSWFDWGQVELSKVQQSLQVTEHVALLPLNLTRRPNRRALPP
jgi:hypothetical protein